MTLTLFYAFCDVYGSRWEPFGLYSALCIGFGSVLGRFLDYLHVSVTNGSGEV